MPHDKLQRSTSKFLSLVLRHDPQSIGLVLDHAGWARVDELLARLAVAGTQIDRALLEHLVHTNEKRRFAFSEDGQRIRANQGHSIDVSLGLRPLPPPDVLYHGTATRSVPAILAGGLDKRARHHVHLTEDIAVASAVGRRYGQLALLQVDAARMHAEGHLFFRAENAVWLTESVPSVYLNVLT